MPALKLSVIVPVAVGDHSWQQLLQDLVQVSSPLEIILVGPEFKASIVNKNCHHVIFLTGCGDRSRQLNLGGMRASGDFLWFLHADSRMTASTHLSLVEGLAMAPDAFHFFHLLFLPDGPTMTFINSFFANLRARYLGLPFGDQGFALGKQLWIDIGQFPQGRKYGEDHALVWQLKRRGVKFFYHRQPIRSSARKYLKNGWGSTTLRHFILTWRQAFSEWRQV